MLYRKLAESDTVGVALEPIPAGTDLGAVTAREAIPAAHKIALTAMAPGDMVYKYGVPIGHATQPIAAGEWVHVHNLATNLKGEESYAYVPQDARPQPPAVRPGATFMGYRRPSGRVGIRNEVWVIPTVGCVGRLAERLAKAVNPTRPAGIDEVVAYPHPCGCSSPGPVLEATQALLANIALHPNAGGILFVGLGCEHNVMAEFRAIVERGPRPAACIDYMVAQEEADEMAVGTRKLEALCALAATATREVVPVSELCVGMKCGASDGLSGVTANPLLGAFSDWLVDSGGSTILTEVPEMFGAERGLLNRARNDEVFRQGVTMINDFKGYYLRYGREIYENPCPGNRDGGISTLEDKSNGCVQKVGSRLVADVLPYAGCDRRDPRAGVALLTGPGEDMVAVSNLAAAGSHLILFTTGRGNPLGAPVPVVKVSSNTPLAAKKPHWIDFDAGPLASGRTMDDVLPDFIDAVLAIASGHKTRNEEFGYRELIAFQDGVIL